MFIDCRLKGKLGLPIDVNVSEGILQAHKRSWELLFEKYSMEVSTFCFELNEILVNVVIVFIFTIQFIYYFIYLLFYLFTILFIYYFIHLLFYLFISLFIY